MDLACALAVNGLVLALIPIRGGERWAIWLSGVTLLILQAALIATDRTACWYSIHSTVATLS